MTSSNKKLIIRLIIALVFFVAGIILRYTLDDSIKSEIIYGSILVIAYLIAGYDVLIGAVRHIISGEFLDELFLMGIATIGAFLLRFFGDIEYIEAVAVMIFFQVGEVFQGIAVSKSRDAIMDTMNLSVTTVTKENGDVVDPDDIKIGDIIVIKPGEMAPVDGIALNDGIINCASLTGEAQDIDIISGDTILSGSIIKNIPINLKVEKEYIDSTATKILDMVENATMRKAKSEKFITKFAKIYTPIVVLFALILAVVPPTIMGFINGFDVSNYKIFIKEALTCLVVSCPCALVVSVPLSYFAGIGCAAKDKIIIKGGNYLEDLAKVDTIILDKTGTLTKAEFEITNVIGDKDEIIKIAKGLEKNSLHPLAKAINKYEGEEYKFNVEETPGFGIKGIKDNDTYLIGSEKLFLKNDIEIEKKEHPGTTLYIAKNNICIGAIILEDQIKDEAKDAINNLLKMNKRIIVLSGDNYNSVKSVCDRLGIKEFYSNLLPSDKVSKVEEILKEKNTGKVLFVGDGINDAPVLALSDIGVSMGAVGSDSAIEASDVVILNDNLKALPRMHKIAKKTRIIVIENIVFSILVKAVILILCAITTIESVKFSVPMWVAIIGDVGVLIIAVLNAMRALRVKKY